jgi:hypothetical protein
LIVSSRRSISSTLMVTECQTKESRASARRFVFAALQPGSEGLKPVYPALQDDYPTNGYAND